MGMFSYILLYWSIPAFWEGKFQMSKLQGLQTQKFSVFVDFVFENINKRIYFWFLKAILHHRWTINSQKRIIFTEHKFRWYFLSYSLSCLNTCSTLYYLSAFYLKQNHKFEIAFLQAPSPPYIIRIYYEAKALVNAL